MLSVHVLTPAKLPWLVRLKLRSVRKKGLTGVLLYGVIRAGSRSISSKKPSVSVREGRRRLGLCSSSSPLPKWAALAAGTHELLFLASRSVSSSSFSGQVSLRDGDVLVAVCEPIQPWVIYAKSPSADTWKLGIIGTDGEIRPPWPGRQR